VQAQEYPLTPAMQAVVAKSAGRAPVWPIFLVMILDVLLVILAIYLVTQRNDLVYGVVLVVVGALALGGVVLWFRNRNNARAKERSSGVYRRLTGPMRTGRDERTESGSTTPRYFLIYGGHRQPIDQDLYDKLVKSRVSWGTVEEVPTTHLIFTVRDANGELVYTHPDYHPDDIAAG